VIYAAPRSRGLQQRHGGNATGRGRQQVRRRRGGRLTVAAGFTNAGAIELTSVQHRPRRPQASLAVAAGTLVNLPATIAALPGTGGPRSLDAQARQQGILMVNADLALGRLGTSNERGDDQRHCAQPDRQSSRAWTPASPMPATITVGGGTP